jgi:hypothetical protein
MNEITTGSPLPSAHLARARGIRDVQVGNRAHPARTHMGHVCQARNFLMTSPSPTNGAYDARLRFFLGQRTQ